MTEVAAALRAMAEAAAAASSRARVAACPRTREAAMAAFSGGRDRGRTRGGGEVRRGGHGDD